MLSVLRHLYVDYYTIDNCTYSLPSLSKHHKSPSYQQHRQHHHHVTILFIIIIVEATLTAYRQICTYPIITRYVWVLFNAKGQLIWVVCPIWTLLSMSHVTYVIEFSQNFWLKEMPSSFSRMKKTDFGYYYIDNYPFDFHTNSWLVMWVQYQNSLLRLYIIKFSKNKV